MVKADTMTALEKNIDALDLPRFSTTVKKERDAYCASLRSLRKDEIDQLIAKGNSAEDWATIRVHPDFTHSFIRNNHFRGACSLGVFDGSLYDTGLGFVLPSSLTNSMVIDSVIRNNCIIHNVTFLNNYYVDSSSLLVNIGTLSCTPDTNFGNGRKLIVGIETGGREILSFADITVDFATSVATKHISSERYQRFISAYTSICSIGYGVIGKNCHIVNCPEITDTLITEGVCCDNIVRLHNTTILSNPEEPASVSQGAYVRNSCVQYGCHIDSMAIVEESILTEYSQVERHGKVTHSLLGPNSSIAEGEVTASLVGPFVGFHHQSLLIGALWPQGKGNVAYGANVGSNHTAKAPDQEIYCGEGIFFGLGTSIKFPADFTRSPYTIIATGVTTLPQRVAFPFSLINTPSKYHASVSPAYNELIPAWVLSDNLYMIRRNEAKFTSRNKARRTAFALEIFRPEIIDLLVETRMRCNNITTIKELYTEADLPGIGKNFITRPHLQKAIEAYSLHIEFYCLKALFEQCTTIIDSDNPGSLISIFTDITDNPRWEHSRQLALSEGIAHRSLNENLDRLCDIAEQMIKLIIASKEKDELRGKTIMDDYALVHVPTERDPFIREMVGKNRLFLQNVQTLKIRLASGEAPSLT